MFDQKEKKFNTFSTLDSATVFRGEIFSKSRIEITGKFEGIIITNDLVIKEGGNINGTVYCYNTLSVQSGKINGKICTKNITLGEKSELFGEIIYSQIEVNKGSVISATLKQVQDTEVKQKIDSYIASLSKSNLDQKPEKEQTLEEKLVPKKNK